MMYIVAPLMVLAVMGLAMSRAYALGKQAGEEKVAVATADRLLEKFREGYRDGSDHGSKTGAALTAERLLEKYREGFKEGQAAGQDKGVADASRQMLEKYQEGYQQGLIAGEDLGIASIEVLTDKEIRIDKGFWRTDRMTSDLFLVIAGSREPRVVRGSATLMNKSQDEISKRISEMRKAVAVIGAGAAGHPGVAAAIAAVPTPGEGGGDTDIDANAA